MTIGIDQVAEIQIKVESNMGSGKVKSYTSKTLIIRATCDYFFRTTVGRDQGTGDEKQGTTKKDLER